MFEFKDEGAEQVTEWMKEHVKVRQDLVADIAEQTGVIKSDHKVPALS